MLEQRGDKYIYHDAPEGDVIEAEVYYTKGGANYFSGNTIQRGVFFSLRAVKLEKKEGYTMKSFELFGGKGGKFFVLPLKAKSAKQIAKVADLFSPHVARIVELLKQDEGAAKAEVFALIHSLEVK